MIILKTQGIVLKTLKYNDNDLIITIFTRKYGKTTAIARGAQRQKSRFLPTSQLFSYNNYVLKKQKDMFSVSQSESIKNFYNISLDFESFSYSSFIVKLVESTIVEGQPNNRMFELLAQTLFLLSENIDNKYFILTAFILKFVDYAGYRPEVFKCTECRKNSFQYAVFSIINGGIVCDKCIKSDKFYIKLDKSTISLMQYVLNNDIIVCSKAKVSKQLIDELFHLMKKYLINYFDGISFKSLDILKNLK